MRTVGVYLAELLARWGIDIVFGIPGVHTVELYRGIGRAGLRHITPRHEQGAGFMADGYARVTGRPAACFVITGPGVTNILTAMGQAYADSIPMLVVSSVNRLGAMGSGAGHLHEMADQRRAAGAVAAFSHTVTHPDELPQVVARAFAVFRSARPRPVHIELPLDVIAASAGHLALPEAPRAPARPVPPGAALDEAAAWLARAAAPVIVTGGGALDGAVAVRTLAEALDAPLVMTINARGLLPAEHELAVSASPSFPAVRRLLADADVVLAAGTEIGPTDFDMYDTGAMSKPVRLIRVDVDAEQAMRGLAADLPLVGDAAATLTELVARVPARAAGDGARRAARARAEGLEELEPGMQRDIAVLDAIRRAVPDAIVVGDSTRMVYAGNLGYAAARPRSWFNAATGFGALGYGLPAAIGAALGAPHRPVICLAGDGGLQFSLAELGAAVEAGARVVLLLLNNRGYGEIKLFMEQKQVPPLGVDLFTPDFQALARAYGWSARLADTPDAVAGLIREAAEGQGCALVEWRD